MSKKISITYSKYFLTLTFEDYLNKNIKDEKLKKDLIESPLMWKFPLDMSENFVEDYLKLFLANHQIDLRSKNKSSSNTNNVIRKIFFNKYNLYHHHMIDNTTYNKEVNMYGKEIQLTPSRNINDEIDKRCHTSNIYLHYQKKETEKETVYKLLLFSIHPRDKEEWDKTKEELKFLFE